MNRRICITLMALPIYFYNAGVDLVSSDLSSLTHQMLSIYSVVENSQNTPLPITPGRISARDEQTGDCWRQRRCKD